MALTQEQQDKINANRKLLSQPLLTTEEMASMTVTAPMVTPTNPAPNPVAVANPTPAAKVEGSENEEGKEDIIDTPEKQAAALEAQRSELEQRAEKLQKERDELAKKLEKPAKTNEPVVLTDEDKKRIAQEYLGVADISEVIKKSELPKPELTADEKEKIVQQRENDKVAYALKNGKFDKKELQSFIEDSKNPQDLVFAQYKQEQKALDSTLTDADIEAEFKEKYSLDEDAESRKFKRGQIEINLLADNIIRNKHSKIIGFDAEYNNIEQTELSQKQVQQKILSEAPKYKRDVESAYAEIGKVKVKIFDKEYELDIPQDVIDAQRDRNLGDKFAAEQIQKGWTKEDIKTDAELSLKVLAFDTLVQKAAEQYHLDHAKGTHGAPAERGGQEKIDTTLSKRVETFRKFHGESATATN